jgi:penicillin-binding protein 2
MGPYDAIKDHTGERRLFLVRVLVAAGSLVVLVALLVARVAYLQIFKHAYYTTQSQDNRMRVQVIPPVRGLIYDRNGVILADNRPAYRLVIVPDQVANLKATLARLARIVTLTQADRQRFYQRKAETPGFRGIPIRLDLSQHEAARFAVNRGHFPGVSLRAGLVRNYPLGKITAPLVGYVGAITARDLLTVNDKRYRGASSIGKSGVEYSDESRLHGYPGSKIVEVTAAGRTLRQLEEDPPAAGKSVYLTLDAKLQKIAYQALGDQDGAVIAINPNTGGILTLVSKPSYNPQLFANGISAADYHRLLTDPDKPLFNRALQGRYPPGSTIKPVMAIAALATGAIDPDKKIWCPGYITLPGSPHRFHGWKRSGMGWVTLHEAIVRSSDVYFYQLGLKLGIDNMHHYASLFGLGEKTGIDLPGEVSGLMPSRAWKHGARGLAWYPGETLNTVIGQGYVSATPLQLAQMAARIAERGRGFKPHVLKAWSAPRSDKRHSYQPIPLKPIVLADKRYWRLVIDAMRDVVSAPYGTAHYYIGQHLQYPIAGKSGTAQVAGLPPGQPVPDEMTMARRYRPHALFIAFAPITTPRIAVAVVVEHGGGGSSVAGPIARRVIDAYLDETATLQAANR